jgi:hypothetical protein
MSDELNAKPPMSYYIIGGLILAWNSIGLLFYYMQVTMTPDLMAANFTPEQVAFMTGEPTWATAAYAIAVNAGVIGALLLLFRKSLALPFFVASFVAVLLQDLNAFVLMDGLGVWGLSGLYLPAVVIVICIAEIWYSRSVANRYYR